jgi:ectoine hydroxylase-related dioxygenase (phytanoyl-CoA dioxygenase family)
MSVEANTERVASAEQRERYEREGYLVIDDLIAPETLDAIVTELEGSFGKPPREEGGVRYFRRRIQDAWKVNDNVKALALAPAVLGLLEDLYGRKPLPFQTLDFLKGTEQAAHSDAIHFSTIPEGYMCGVWVALEDIDADNGPLVYYPGSHKFPYLRPADIGLEAKWDDYPDYEQYVADLLEREKLEPAYGTIKKGQAIVWAANLLHGGAPQHDPDRTRLSQVTHYFFEGCKYFTPMRSEGENVLWRDPVWVA